MLVDSKSYSNPLRRRLRRLTLSEKIEEAEAFLRLFANETNVDSGAAEQRRRDVVKSLRRHGHYDHTGDELAFGARLAWRNHANCIGRLYWKSLVVRDCRDLAHPDDIAAHVAEHMVEAHNNGKIRSVMSVFSPVKQDALPAYIENRQVVQYAGYLTKDERVLGDPLNAEFTRSALSLGWTSPEDRGPFDRLPLIVRDANERRHVYNMPESSIREVEIRHPTMDGLARLGLRWYTVPCVCDMILTIGGVDYPCAPFNGFYMATEIASRNFLDTYRYDMAERVAEAIGLDRSDPFWKDEVGLQLNRAVLHSYQADGVSIVDHHTASKQFIDFMQIEHANSRMPSGNWMWIVPPQAPSACPVFHVRMKDTRDVPNFYRSRADGGAHLRPYRGLEERSTTVVRLERGRRRLREWWKRHQT